MTGERWQVVKALFQATVERRCVENSDRGNQTESHQKAAPTTADTNAYSWTSERSTTMMPSCRDVTALLVDWTRREVERTHD